MPGPVEPSSGRVFVRWTIRIALAGLPWFALIAFLLDSRFLLPIRGALLTIALAAVWFPAFALLAAAAVVPFCDVLLITAGSPPVRGPEAVVVAFLAGWLLNRAISNRAGPTNAARWPALLLAAVVIASIAQVALELYRADPEGLWSALRAARDAYFAVGDSIGLVRGAEIIDGIALTFAIVELASGRPERRRQLLGALALSGALAAVLALLLSFDVGLPISLARYHAAGLRRFAAHIGDVNAAGSYYLIAAGAAYALAATAAARARIAWYTVTLLAAIGLVLSGSRSAWAAALIGIAGVVLSRQRMSRQPLIWLASAAVAIVGVAFALLAVATILRVPIFTFFGDGLDMRLDFSAASARMIAARPWFGIGIGRYYALSHLVFSPSLANVYGYENAHDYYLQIFAELGTLGLAAFLWFLAAILWPARHELRREPSDAHLGALVAGVCAFLLTCISGHPMLVPEVAVPFWLALGLVAASREPSPSSLPSFGARSGWRAAAVAAAVVLILASVPLRPGPPRLRLPQGKDGFGPWQTADGRRFHEVAAEGALYFQPSVTFVEIPMRLSVRRAGRPVTVFLKQPLWSTHRVVVSDRWQAVPVTLPTLDPLAPFQRIDVQVVDYADPHGDTHGEGVEIGEVTILGTRD